MKEGTTIKKSCLPVYSWTRHYVRDVKQKKFANEIKNESKVYQCT